MPPGDGDNATQQYHYPPRQGTCTALLVVHSQVLSPRVATVPCAHPALQTGCHTGVGACPGGLGFRSRSEHAAPLQKQLLALGWVEGEIGRVPLLEALRRGLPTDAQSSGGHCRQAGVSELRGEVSGAGPTQGSGKGASRPAWHLRD